MSNYKIGKAPPQWSESAQTITFIVTEDCNLRCKYCYISHKSSQKRMKLETAKKFIDYILSADIKFSDSVIIEFFGGEPTIEMPLVDQISDYFKIKAYELSHPWAWNYRFNFATNGVNYSSPEVQTYIEKNLGKVSIGISIDGIKAKHDLNRVFPDGSGSYDTIEKNIPLWITQFAPATKMTFASDDLCYLKDSVIDLWAHGITDVSANVVFENVWKENDDILFENQMKELADYILDNHLFDKYYCTLFSDSIGGYLTKEERNNTYCGSGKMLAVDPDGNLYPCVRYKGYSLNNKPERIVGTVETGINMELVRPFMVAAERYQDDSECAYCPIASGCPQCQGLSYDEADTPTNFQRAKYICKMQKARVRANEYFFAKLYNRFGIRREFLRNTAKMYFLLNDNFTTFCCYDNSCRSEQPGKAMSLEMIEQGLRYCRQNFMSPVFVHGTEQFLNIDFSRAFEEHHIQHIIPIHLRAKAASLRDVLVVIDHSSIDLCDEHLSNCIYNIHQSKLQFLAGDVISLFNFADRINVNVLGLNQEFDENSYYEQLMQIKNYLVEISEKGSLQKEINILTDLCFIDERNNCKAGERAFAYAPNGEFFACPAFYFDDTQTSVGSPKDGIYRLKNSHLYRCEYHPICQVCDAKQCRICIYQNLQGTKEINVSPSFQCRKSHIERRVSIALKGELALDDGKGLPALANANYLDPIMHVPALKDHDIGYYKCKE